MIGAWSSCPALFTCCLPVDLVPGQTSSGFRLWWKLQCPVWRAVRRAVAIRGRAVTAGMSYLYCPLDYRTPVRTLTSPAISSLVWPRATGQRLFTTSWAVSRRRQTSPISRYCLAPKDSSGGIQCGRNGTGSGLSPITSAFLCQNYFTDPPFSLTWRAMDGQWAPFRPHFRRNINQPHSSSSP
jgi:hypothetical protein